MTLLTVFLAFYFGGMFATAGLIISANKIKSTQPQMHLQDLEENETIYGLFSIIFWPIFSFGGIFVDD